MTCTRSPSTHPFSWGEIHFSFPQCSNKRDTVRPDPDLLTWMLAQSPHNLLHACHHCQQYCTVLYKLIWTSFRAIRAMSLSDLQGRTELGCPQTKHLKIQHQELGLGTRAPQTETTAATFPFLFHISLTSIRLKERYKQDHSQQGTSVYPSYKNTTGNLSLPYRVQGPGFHSNWKETNLSIAPMTIAHQGVSPVTQQATTFVINKPKDTGRWTLAS